MPHVPDDEHSDRVDAEERNVRVRAFLYAASVEDDNDYHLIIGRAPGLAPKVYMTVEVSGLPSSGSPSFARLRAARDAYKSFYRDSGIDLPGERYQHYDPPFEVEVEGSLFFDVTHLHGSRPGPSKLRPHMPTIWEVHPVSEIVFRPD